jgi:diguanylate cyclase (GGDEF)-like protein
MTDAKDSKQKLVLIVDDDPCIRMLIGETLVSDGFRVEKAEDGMQALALLENCTPDLIMLDVIMPGMDGFEFCSRLREIPGKADVPIVIITGSNDLVSIQRAYEVGVTDFITKPIPLGVIAYRVSFIIRATKAFSDLKKSESRLMVAQRLAKIGNWELGPESGRIWLSDEARGILRLGSHDNETSYQTFIDCVHPVDRLRVEKAIAHAIEYSGYCSIDCQLQQADGVNRFMQVEAEVIRDWKSVPIRLEGTIQDISERKNAEDKITNLAFVDILTGLPNRLLFMEHTKRIHLRSQLDQGKYAILFLNVDELSSINDMYGHAMGDSLLQQLAQRLKTCVRISDLYTSGMVSRFGGDEFVVVVDSISNAADMGILAKRIIDQMCLPVQLGATEVVVTVSIGISIFPDDGDDVITLIKNADIAMYSAKEEGKCGYRFFTKSVNDAILMHLRMENNLKSAISNNEFILHYQPQVELDGFGIVGFEALIRWHNQELGEVLPEVFIPLAEKSHLIWEIDRWVLDEACRQLRKWQDSGISGLRIAVKISGRGIKQNNLVAIVSQAIERHGIGPHALQLELTEGILMANAAASLGVLVELKKIGVSLAIDDIGTGYSSLTYLQKLPIDALKIDQSFVAGISDMNDPAPVISAIIALAQSLQLSIVAEGIESEMQQDFLRMRGCLLGQGFLFSRPVPADEVPLIVSQFGLKTVDNEPGTGGA